MKKKTSVKRKVGTTKRKPAVDKFKRKVKSMSFKQIVGAMIAGLEKKHVAINMDTFGIVRDGVCYGCAATNAVCEIAKVKLDAKSIGFIDGHNTKVKTDGSFLYAFECAIDYLRVKFLINYDFYASIYGFATSTGEARNSIYFKSLPVIKYGNENELKVWKQFHASLKD